MTMALGTVNSRARGNHHFETLVISRFQYVYPCPRSDFDLAALCPCYHPADCEPLGGFGPGGGVSGNDHRTLIKLLEDALIASFSFAPGCGRTWRLM